MKRFLANLKPKSNFYRNLTDPDERKSLEKTTRQLQNEKEF